ncbi:MAG: 23S rRNA (adenine(2503)-C(2))-methyltransferase RlmN [Pseudomonadota bacterium]|nr:23S rRNA (adenine(2503)-C(2))-methyltransferase RlmN [Pseudomonadota bacterium]
MSFLSETIPAADHPTRIDLVGLSREELSQTLAELDLPDYRSKQIWHWIYYRGAKSFDEMTTLAKPLRRDLAERFSISRAGIATAQISNDGTRKWLLDFSDGKQAETVFIPESDRGALCISSQVGCTLSCSFCHTGTQPMVRNLTAGEIVGQMMTARDEIGEWPAAQENRLLSNIVMMGMGEPLYNYDNVVKALRIITDEDGMGFSKRRITLSTAGVAPRIADVGRDLGVRLAISLHAVTDDIRDILVPLNKRYPIKELLDSCRAYPGSRNSRRITFEYIMLKGVNDSPADARELVRLIKGIPAKINLIPFNAWPGVEFECSSDGTIAAFAEIINRAGYTSPVRQPRGRDIMAACGQLKSVSEQVRKSRRIAQGKNKEEQE